MRHRPSLHLPGRPPGLLLAVALLAGVAVAVPAQSGAAPSDAQAFTLDVLSTRADLVSGGDALVEVGLPAGTNLDAVTLTVADRDVTDAFAVRPGGAVQGLVTGLALGPNLLEVRDAATGEGARLTITNHPIGGPVFSGPQIQPWTCTGVSLDAQCNRAPAYTFHYKSTGGSGLAAYDPKNPPTDVATTTTDQGNTVPFIVRQEIGVLARDQYRIAVLYDPAAPDYQPWAPQKGYNNKVVITHGASCDTGYAMASAPGVLNETALARGFAVLSHALDNAGHNCNIVTQAESLVMTKELLAEKYGPIRYAIGSGCSGGALAQQQVANAYPGVYQGITPACSYPDAWSSSMQYVDYDRMLEYFKAPQRWSPGTVWDATQIQEVLGHPNPGNPVTFTTVIPNSGKPTRSCPGVPADKVYDAQTNKTGVRCTFSDYMVNVFGKRPDGIANRPSSNVGVLYGLQSLKAGRLLPQQFVDLNTKIGGLDIDYVRTEERTGADPLAAERVYRSGAVNTAEHLDEVAIIDLRGPDPGVFHDVYRTYALRERLLREHGTADNQVLWRGSVAISGDSTFAADSIVAMDRWLAVVEKDGRDVPLARKIIEARGTAGVVDRCTSGTGRDLPAQYCEVVVSRYATPRINAGMPTTDDVMTCRLVPMRRADFPNIVFTDGQWTALAGAFPTGRCDYTAPDPHRVPTVTWLDYSGGPGGQPLGPPPVSVPLD